MVFKRVCVAAFMDVTFIAFDVPMIRTPRLAVTHQPAVIPVIEGTAVIGSADVSGGMRLLCVPLTPALMAYEKIGAAFGAEGALPHLPVVCAHPSKHFRLGVEFGRTVAAFVTFGPVDGSLLKHGTLRRECCK